MEIAKKERIVYLDVLRIISAFSVVCIHVVSNSQIWECNDILNPNWSVLNFFTTVTRSAVPVFFMISGSLMLSDPEKYNIKRLYSRNILRMGVAFVFWSAFYTFTDVVIFGSPKTLSDVLNSFLCGKVHMWYIFLIVLFYAATPLLHRIVEDKNTELYMLVLLLIPSVYDFVSLVFSYVPLNNFYMKFELTASYLVYYIAGHYISKYEIKKKFRYIIYALGVLSLCLTLWMIDSFTKRGISSSYVVGTRTSINIFLTAAAVFVFAKYALERIRFSEKYVKVISAVSKCTFGIYLVHYFIVEFSAKKLNFSVDTVPSAWLVPLMAVVFFAVSLAVSFVISKIPVLKKYII